jgi:hypothetical protein
MLQLHIRMNILLICFRYMLPGRPIAMMLFKTYGYITMRQALAFAQDLKLGWYLKVPPKTMFMCQLVGKHLAFPFTSLLKPANTT